MKHDVFISYSSQDKVAAQAICHTLEQNGIRCWIAPRDIPAGTEYGDLIDEAIKEATVVVIIFSENAAASSWVKGEMNIAFEEQKVIIPFRLDNTPLKGQSRVILNQKHWIDAFRIMKQNSVIWLMQSPMLWDGRYVVVLRMLFLIVKIKRAYIRKSLFISVH